MGGNQGEHAPPPRADQTPAELVKLGKSFTQTNYWFRPPFPLFPSTLLPMLKRPSASPTMTSCMEPRGRRRMTPHVNNVHVAVASGSLKRHRSRAAPEIKAGSHPAAKRRAKKPTTSKMVRLSQVLFTARAQHCNQAACAHTRCYLYFTCTK